MMNRLLLAIGILGLLLASGCGSKHSPLGKVEGTVRYRGQPIAAGAVVFEIAGARPAQGKIVDGKITEVTTRSPGDGVPLGLARIAVFAVPATKPNAPAGTGTWILDGAPSLGKPLIPAKFNNLATSGLTWKIVEGKNDVALDLAD
jgi:hypothetical protein